MTQQKQNLCATTDSSISCFQKINIAVKLSDHQSELIIDEVCNLIWIILISVKMLPKDNIRIHSSFYHTVMSMNCMISFMMNFTMNCMINIINELWPRVWKKREAIFAIFSVSEYKWLRHGQVEFSTVENVAKSESHRRQISNFQLDKNINDKHYESSYRHFCLILITGKKLRSNGILRGGTFSA